MNSVLLDNLAIGAICPALVWLLTLKIQHRANRLNFIILFVLFNIMGLAFNLAESNLGNPEAINVHIFNYSLFISSPIMLATVFRCNDVGYSKLIPLIGLIPFVNFLLWLRLMFAKTDEARKQTQGLS